MKIETDLTKITHTEFFARCSDCERKSRSTEHAHIRLQTTWLNRILLDSYMVHVINTT